MASKLGLNINHPEVSGSEINQILGVELKAPGEIAVLELQKVAVFVEPVMFMQIVH